MKNQYPLSLSSDTFNSMKTDFDMLLRKLITEMERREEEDATINIKVAVHLEQDQARDFEAGNYDAMRDIIKPTFKHEITTVLQVKDKKSGSLGGNLEMVWDRDAHDYVLRDIDNGQVSFADSDNGERPSNVIDVKFSEVTEEPPALMGRKMAELPAPEDPDGRKGAFDWLAQFVGEGMKIVISDDGNPTVRTLMNNDIVLTSSDPDSIFYCPPETLMQHAGHALECYLYQPDTSDKTKYVAVECSECHETLFSMSYPQAENDADAENIPDDLEDETLHYPPSDDECVSGLDDEPTDDGYGYDEPDVEGM